MRLVGIAAAIVTVAACSATKGTEPPVKKDKAVDPYVSILVIDSLDTTTAPGRAEWHGALHVVDTVVSSAMAAQGSISLQDIRLGHRITCVAAQSDSIGARLIDPVFIADTTTDQLVADSISKRMLTAWGNGDTTLDSGWMVLHTGLIDAWTSAQFLAGHGRSWADPVRWYLVWKGRGTVVLTERASTDTSVWPCT